MLLWWKSLNFELSFEGSLFCESPNKQGLQYMMPYVCWLGSCEGVSYESYIMLTTATFSGAVSKIEEESVGH